MKKYLAYTFLVIGLFLLCLSTSLLFKNTLGLEGDYLSAFSTTVAALVAILLFNDWRDEQEYQTKKEFIFKVRHIYDELHDLNFNHIDARAGLIYKLKNNLYDSEFHLECFNSFSIFKMKMDFLITKILITLEEYEVVSNQKEFIEELDKALVLRQKSIHEAYQCIVNDIKVKDINTEDVYKNFEEFNNVINIIIGEIYQEIISELIKQLRPFRKIYK
ncbi:hypothetical protein OHW85_15970 [Acinetobacter baumannii]|nr:hypothetical protein [Acinetobacter baumannii]